MMPIGNHFSKMQQRVAFIDDAGDLWFPVHPETARDNQLFCESTGFVVDGPSFPGARETHVASSINISAWLRNKFGSSFTHTDLLAQREKLVHALFQGEAGSSTEAINRLIDIKIQLAFRSLTQ